MERRKFLSRFGLGAIGAVVATKVVIDIPEEEILGEEASVVLGDGWVEQMRKGQNYYMYTDLRGRQAFEEALRELSKQ